ncbi:MAG: alpha/beta fold hydrolase [Actinobacteria bacterium]|nr:alpha/beta fold hydrolase [Actinomycetota bacterium]
MQSREIGCVLVLVLGLLASAGCGGGNVGASQSSTLSHPKALGPFTVRVGERLLSGRCEGRVVSGQPTFVLEAGQGNGATELQPVAQALTGIGLVCSYDRAGFGGSDPVADHPRPLGALLTDLRTVLAAGGFPKPYFLVGHSLGGSMVLLYAQLYPDDLVGFVSMNPGPTYHDWLRRLRPIVSRKELVENEIRPLTGGVPEEPVDTRGSDALVQKPFPQHMPYTIMYAEDCSGGTDLYCNKVVGQLEAAQRALAALSPEGRFVAVRGAGHEIWATDLDRVVAAVKHVMARSK